MILVVFAGLLASESNASEVYYLGQGLDETNGSATQARDFSLQKRLSDLIDLKNYKNYGPERSGMITGSVMEEVAWNEVGGNETKSFLKTGVSQNTEINLNAYERLWQDYNFEGQMFLRRTDDRRIERRKDLRVKQLTARIANADNLLTFGDFYGDFSNFTLGNSLEGFYLETKISEDAKFKGVAARSQSPDNDQLTFWRHVFGGKTDVNLFKNSAIFSLFRLGIQAVTNQDDEGSSESIGQSPAIIDRNNTVVSVDGEIALKKYFSVLYEIARSADVADETAEPKPGYEYGTALRVNPILRVGATTVKYLYYFVDPSFRTDAGSAATDKIQHQLSLDHQITPRARLSLIENYYWDDLPGSSKTARTTYNEKYMSIYLRPCADNPDLSIRGYTNLQERYSNDAGNTLEATTITPGIAVNNSFDQQTTYGFFYEFRGFVDKHIKSNSDYFNRFGVNIGREQMIAERRAYVSASGNLDFHDPRQYTKDEVTTSLSFSGQYNFYQDHMLYLGYNLAMTNTFSLLQSSLNHTSYVEINLLINKVRSSRIVLRGELNDYNQQDKDQSYDEARIIAKFITNF